MRLTETECFVFMVEDAKRYFGQWDMCDPVVWALLRVVLAQNDFQTAIDWGSSADNEQMVEEAIKERRKSVAALQEALEREPRGHQ